MLPNYEKEENKEIQKALFFGENEIKKNITSTDINPIFKKYGLINKDWFYKYKNFLFGTKQKPNYNIKLLTPTLDNQFLNYNNYSYTFLIPKDFIIVPEKVINIISNHFDAQQKKEINNLIYDLIIGGNCIIIKDKKNNNIIFIYLFNNQHELHYNKEIDFILAYNNKQELDIYIKDIIKNKFENYLKFNNISLNSGDIQSIKNSKNQLIVNIIPKNYLNTLATTMKRLIKEDILPNLNAKTHTQSSNLKLNDNLELKAILLCLYQFKDLIYNELKNISYDSKYKITQLLINFFENFEKINIIDKNLNDEFKNSLKSKDYKIIIKDILDKLDSELTQKKKTKTVEDIKQYTEKEAKEIFDKEHKNPSIIEKLFYIKLQKKTICPSKEINFKYYYSECLVINLDNENKNVLLSDKLINTDKKNEMIKCYCKIEKSMHSVENRIVDFPKILVVIIEGNKIANFSLKNQYNIYIDKENNKLYILRCFIERNTNFVYYKRRYFTKFKC